MRALEGSAFHSLILEQVTDAVIAIDPDGIVTYLNPAAERLYRTASERAVGRPLGDLYTYGWLDPQEERRAEAALARDGYWRGENLHRLADGSVLQVESSVSELRDESGAQVGLLAVIRDVTSARRAEEAAREREVRLRRVLAIEAVGVLFFRLDGRITDANQAFERMSGYSVDELRGSVHWRTLTPPEFLEPTTRAARNLLTVGETAPYHKQMIRKDGSRWWGLFAPKRISGTGPTAECVEFILDITEARRAEAALQELEQRQRMALDAAQLGTWQHDLASGMIELDARARRHYGFEQKTIAADELLARIHPDDAADLARAMRDSLDPSIRRTVAIEYRVRHRDGSVRWLSVSGQVRFGNVNGETRATAAVGTTRDITQQKQVEAALRDADQRKDEFLAILAHELRNPLAPIRTAVGLMRAENVPEPLLLRARAIIERQVAHMARLVDDLLDVSRLSRGQMSLQRARVPLDEILDLALETARPLIDERGHQLTEHRASTQLLLDGDAARLSQVFANLLNNAAKYTAPGGSITLAVTADEGHVDVSVTDTGQGIAPEYLGKVFELFAQGGGSGPSSVGGLGIGLALARRLVELHGGQLTAASGGPGRGATMTVRLPAASAELERHAPPEPERPVASIGRRVLVVDDNRDGADTLAMLLRASGCEVQTAYSGEEALSELPEFNPEVVLLDLGMPGLDGLEACRRIRRLPNGDTVRIIAITGWGQEESRRRTQLAGFDAHIVKPVAPDALLQAVQNAARGARQ